MECGAAVVWVCFRADSGEDWWSWGRGGVTPGHVTGDHSVAEVEPTWKQIQKTPSHGTIRSST